MVLNRVISFTHPWSKTGIIALTLGGVLALVLVLLQPFDTYSMEMEYKGLRLSVYGLIVAVMVLLIHPLENFWYARQGRQWRVLNEVVMVATGLLLMLGATFLYLSYFINHEEPTLSSALDFMLYFGSPYIPLFTPLWLYLRY